MVMCHLAVVHNSDRVAVSSQQCEALSTHHLGRVDRVSSTQALLQQQQSELTVQLNRVAQLSAELDRGLAALVDSSRQAVHAAHGSDDPASIKGAAGSVTGASSTVVANALNRDVSITSLPHATEMHDSKSYAHVMFPSQLDLYPYVQAEADCSAALQQYMQAQFDQGTIAMCLWLIYYCIGVSIGVKCAGTLVLGA